MKTLQTTIENAYDARADFSAKNTPPAIQEAIQETMQLLETGKIRVAEKINQQWTTHGWIQKAILLFFKTTENQLIDAHYTHYYDKVPLKFHQDSAAYYEAQAVRMVPGSIVRFGAFIEPHVVLMPSFVNMGAYVGSGTLIDTWATVGSCAQIGKHVHLSGGAGIGGVLEPIGSAPTIIEDHCFIGARSEIVEGVIVEEGAVISMGVFIGQSTPIYNRLTDEIFYGRIPAYSVVIPGALPSQDGKYSRNCAIIVKQVTAQTRQKTAINDILRE